MGYWTGEDLPFYYGLAKTFPLADRFFCSVLAQTYPNRRFLLAGSAYGLVDDDLASLKQSAPNGTIFDRLDQHSISWKNYYSSLASSYLVSGTRPIGPGKLVPIADFFKDAASGQLPGFSLVDPDFQHSSEEDPQNILVGEAFAARVINAVMEGPAWSKTLLIWNYDEHGGYYDHVPPPAAIPPDSIPPSLPPSQHQPGGYDRYGFRVPCAIVSPLARRNYVSHVVHDHTSVLKLIETKWNLPALTYRDANASNLLDSIDLKGKPAFLDPPRLPAPNQNAKALACTSPPSSEAGGI
jgi:phospholipase C